MKFVWCSNDTILDLEKVRNFKLFQDNGLKKIVVIAWFNDSESLHLNQFNTATDATKYLNELIGVKK